MRAGVPTASSDGIPVGTMFKVSRGSSEGLLAPYPIRRHRDRPGSNIRGAKFLRRFDRGWVNVSLEGRCPNSLLLIRSPLGKSLPGLGSLPGYQRPLAESIPVGEIKGVTWGSPNASAETIPVGSTVTGPGDRTAVPKASWLGTPVGEIVAVPGVTTGSPTASSDAIPAGAT